MTYTKDNEANIAGLTVVLKSLKHSAQPIPLDAWLPEMENAPTWVPLTQQNGVTRVMPVSTPQVYPALMQTICQQISWNTSVEWQGKIYELTGIEIDTHELHILEIPISPVKSLPLTTGRAIHAQCFQWFATANADLADQLHRAETLPITLSLKTRSPHQATLRINLLQRELLAPLLLGVSKDLDTEISVANIPCRLGHSLNIVQTNSFQQLVQTPCQETITLQYLTPTSFKNDKHIQPFPLPELVFSSLRRRWNSFAPEDLHFPRIDWQGLVSAFDIKTRALKMEGGAEIGSVGWVRYQFPDPEQARIATILAHFATFAGVGRKTAMGMGQVQLKYKNE